MSTDDGRDDAVGAALGAGFRLLLWDYGRDSLAYDLVLALIALVVLLVPAGFWGDPLWLP